MQKWLFDILKDNTLCDNQEYYTNNGVLANPKLHEPILLYEKATGQHYKPWNDTGRIWNFISKISYDINKYLQENRNSSFVLFNNKEYEHNTDDNFINVTGVNCQNFTLKTGNVIGFVTEGSYSIKIGSRFGDNFLKYIIADADGFLSIENFGGKNDKHDFEWLLIYLWCIKLKKAFRLGLPKAYKSYNESISTVKGQITPLDYYLNGEKGKYKCNYREHSYDTLQAALILEAYYKVKDHDFVNELHTIKSEIEVAIKGKRKKPLKLYNTSHFTNPFYSDYNDVIDLSKSILREEFSGFGIEKETNAFLFDVSMLFEYFIKKLFIRSGFSLKSKFSDSLTIATGTCQRKIQPDLIINSRGGLSIFDVKYKNFNDREGVERVDLFQIHTYIGQYGNNDKITACGFIYPGAKGENRIIEEHITITGKSVPFYIFILGVPKSSNENFAQLFHNKCESLMNIIKTKLN